MSGRGAQGAGPGRSGLTGPISASARTGNPVADLALNTALHASSIPLSANVLAMLAPALSPLGMVTPEASAVHAGTVERMRAKVDLRSERVQVGFKVPSRLSPIGAARQHPERGAIAGC